MWLRSVWERIGGRTNGMRDRTKWGYPARWRADHATAWGTRIFSGVRGS